MPSSEPAGNSPAHLRHRCRAPALAALLLALPAAGCSGYHPLPLEAPNSRRLTERPSELRVAATALEHPYLAPLPLDLDDGLNADEAAVLAVLANPDLEALRARRGLAAAQVLAAGILPNPQLTLSASRPQNDAAAITGTGVGLGFDLGALISRGARRAGARLESQQVDLDIAWQEWQVAQAARLQVYRSYFLAAQLELAAESEATLGASYEVTAAAAERRLVTEVDRAAAEASLHEARALRLAAETATARARLELLRLLGLPPDSTLEVRADGPLDPLTVPAAGPSEGDLDAMLSGLEARRLDLAALRLGYESQEEHLRAAVLSRFPAIALSLDRLRDPDRRVTLDPAVSFELPIFDRKQGEIAVERATREVLRREYEARVFQAKADAADLAAAGHWVERQLEQAEVTVDVRRRLVAVYGRALRLRDADVLTYQNAQIDLLTSELDLLALRLSMAELRVGLATVLGRSTLEPESEGNESP